MTKGVNKVILIGNAGSDPEMRRANNGNAVASLSIATSERWRDKNSGEQQERTEWHRVVFFGRIAEIVGDYVRKGSKIYVEGKLQTRKWVTQEGQDRYTTEVVVDISGSMQLLDSRNDRPPMEANNSQYNDNTSSHSQPPPPRNNNTQATAANVANPSASAEATTDNFDDDDIPF